jgi:hypothetical protein
VAPTEHGTDELARPAADAARVVLGRYELGHRLGAGGFGAVFAAHDLKLDREVAVKRIPSSDPAIAERARREGLAAARLSHPAIVALHETGADDDAVYLVSELVRGRTLDRRCADGELSDRDVLRIGIVLCDALAHAHKAGVVHRDVKPANVLVPDEALEEGVGPAAKLTDFGIARLADSDALTRTGDVVGTLAYMAPEQAEGRGAGPPADLYALGLCLYEALAGVNPVRARGAGATVRRIGQRLPALGRLRRDLPLDLCEAIDAAVWPDPDERGTVRRLRAALQAALQDVGDEPGTIDGSPLEPAVAPILHARPRARSAWRTRLASAGAAGAATAAVLLAAGPPPPDRPAAWAAGAALGCLVLPRSGWVLLVAALAAWLAGTEPGTAAVLVAGALPALLVPWLPRPRILRRAAAGAAAGWVAILAVRADEQQGWRGLSRTAWEEVVVPAPNGGAWWVLVAGAVGGVLLGAVLTSRRQG